MEEQEKLCPITWVLKHECDFRQRYEHGKDCQDESVLKGRRLVNMQGKSK
jgi:hypothetical protein